MRRSRTASGAGTVSPMPFASWREADNDDLASRRPDPSGKAAQPAAIPARELLRPHRDRALFRDFAADRAGNAARAVPVRCGLGPWRRSEEPTSELHSLMSTAYA